VDLSVCVNKCQQRSALSKWQHAYALVDFVAGSRVFLAPGSS